MLKLLFAPGRTGGCFPRLKTPTAKSLETQGIIVISNYFAAENGMTVKVMPFSAFCRSSYR